MAASVSVSAGSAAPDFTLTSYAGEIITLSTVLAKHTAVLFFSGA